MVFEKVRNMIATQLQVDPASITMESRLVEDLKADSANVMVMILEMETEFGMEVEDEVILQLKTVGDIGRLYRKASVILRRTGCASAHPRLFSEEPWKGAILCWRSYRRSWIIISGTPNCCAGR